jgi:hypothetical protein
MSSERCSKELEGSKPQISCAFESGLKARLAKALAARMDFVELNISIK